MCVCTCADRTVAGEEGSVFWSRGSGREIWDSVAQAGGRIWLGEGKNGERRSEYVAALTHLLR